MSTTVLSTKKLSPAQRELLLNAGIGLVQTDFISIVPIPFEINRKYSNMIITSKNALRQLLEHPIENLEGARFFCVGRGTSELLRKNGFNVVTTTDYGSELLNILTEEHSNEEFLFLCGRKRRDEIPEGLSKMGITFTEIAVYDTELKPKRICREFDGILFFSPSGVESYCRYNKISGEAFCIGRTTAKEAARHTEKFHIAKYPSVENVLSGVIRRFGRTSLQNKQQKNYDSK